MPKNEGRRPAIDPAVAEMLSEMEQKKRISHLPKSKQGKARKNAKRHKVGLDLPPALHESLRQIAERERISVSGLVTFYLYQGVIDYKAGKVEISSFKRISRSPRFEYILDFAEMEKS